MAKSCKSIIETDRIILRKIATRISDIANNLSSKYKPEIHDDSVFAKQPMLVYLTLTEILSEKKYQYKHSPVEFTLKCNSIDKFSFMAVEPINFKRMISNLINNSAEALSKHGGKVVLKLLLVKKSIKILIQDNGKGMSQEIVNKIMNNIAVTSGKENGSGIGYIQIMDPLRQNNGTLVIESKIGQGTTIILTFPIINDPHWMIRKINITYGDVIVILDDDSSIHRAWEIRLKSYKPKISVKHFKLGKEAIAFINGEKRQGTRMVLLADYELIDQNINGLQVIKLTEMQEHAILVTSHHAEVALHTLAVNSGIKILPKQLASSIPIEISVAKPCSKKTVRQVDAVFIDDDQMLIDSLSSYFGNMGKTVDKYYSPMVFLENIARYPKKTKIFMDNDLSNKIDGIGLAKTLYEIGYTQLYMFSGKEFAKKEVPDFLTIMGLLNSETKMSTE